jgi:hypothetical protein
MNDFRNTSSVNKVGYNIRFVIMFDFSEKCIYNHGYTIKNGNTFPYDGNHTVNQRSFWSKKIIEMRLLNKSNKSELLR